MNIDKETYGLAMEHIKYYCDFQRKIKGFLQELPDRMTELLDSAAKLEKGRLDGTVTPEVEESLQRLHAVNQKLLKAIKERANWLLDEIAGQESANDVVQALLKMLMNPPLG